MNSNIAWSNYFKPRSIPCFASKKIDIHKSKSSKNKAYNFYYLPMYIGNDAIPLVHSDVISNYEHVILYSLD